MKGSRLPASKNVQNTFIRKCALQKSQAQMGSPYSPKSRLQQSLRKFWRTFRQSLTLKSMSVRAKKPQHQIVVKKENLTTRSLSPSSQELFELMHLTSCDHAIQRWKANWLLCPVCNGAIINSAEGSYVEHKTREDILV